jgi:hypothetical protein
MPRAVAATDGAADVDDRARLDLAGRRHPQDLRARMHEQAPRRVVVDAGRLGRQRDPPEQPPVGRVALDLVERLARERDLAARADRQVDRPKAPSRRPAPGRTAPRTSPRLRLRTAGPLLAPTRCRPESCSAAQVGGHLRREPAAGLVVAASPLARRVVPLHGDEATGFVHEGAPLHRVATAGLGAAVRRLAVRGALHRAGAVTPRGVERRFGPAATDWSKRMSPLVSRTHLPTPTSDPQTRLAWGDRDGQREPACQAG